MKIRETSLPGVLVITPTIYRDDRGAFFETYNEREMGDVGLPRQWAQDNFSLSKKNVLRGIHYQISQPQGKLVRVTHGAVLDVAVDLRRGSPAFGRHMAMELTGENAEMLYKVNSYYSSSAERTILWNDPELAIPWPIAPEDAIVSAKDRLGAMLRDAEVFP